MIKINPATDALFVVDALPTFMPGGGLGVPQGDEIIPVIKYLLPFFPKERRIAIKDKHKKGSVSLASSYVGMPQFHRLTYEEYLEGLAPGRSPIQLAPHALFGHEQLQAYLEKVGYQTLWPDHAIEGTAEAELHPELPEDLFGIIQVKGMDPACDSYSGFFDALHRPTGLGKQVRAINIKRGFYVGLCGNVCVGHTANDGTEEGIEAFMVVDATRDVPIEELTNEMFRRFRDRNVHLIHSSVLEAA